MKRWLLRFLRVAERPTPPPGAGDSFELFNPSKKLLLLSWLRWGWGQVWALVGVLASLAFLGTLNVPAALAGVDRAINAVRNEMDLDRELTVEIFGVAIESELQIIELITWAEMFAVGLFVVQFVVSAVLVRLRWEMHWYMVSDRILGIRKGLMKVSEQTMTIANVQNMRIKQGPVQRLFGISDLVVHTAGGAGSAGNDANSHGKELHVGLFEGLDDAESLRQTIRATLARTKTSGLGDPDDETESESSSAMLQPVVAVDSDANAPAEVAADSAALAGVSEPSLRDEARALKDAARRARVATDSLLQALSRG